MSVDERAEGQPVPEARGHVGDAHVPVTFALDPTPLLQRLHGRHPAAVAGERRSEAGSECRGDPGAVPVLSRLRTPLCEGLRSPYGTRGNTEQRDKCGRRVWHEFGAGLER